MNTIHLNDQTIGLKHYYYVTFEFHREIYARFKQLPGAFWDKHERSWVVDRTVLELEDLRAAFSGLAELKVTQVPLRSVEERKARLRPIDFLEQLSPTHEGAIDQFASYLRSKRYSSNTVQTYVDALRTFIRFLQPSDLGAVNEQDIIRFNNEYILANDYSSSYQNQVVNAIKLFYRRVYSTQLDLELVHRPKREKNLPNVLSKEEVRQIINAPRNIKHKAMLSLIYACGMRRSELLGLKIEDVQSKRGLIIIRQSKGKKDRVVPLSSKLLELLRVYYKLYRPKIWLFEGQISGERYSEKSLENVFKQNLVRSGITKKATLHWLRHSYATHLLESGTDLRYIQELLGHNSSRTTEIYTHVSQRNIQQIKSPFDDL
jgi:integrase/recombinase XerD